MQRSPFRAGSIVACESHPGSTFVLVSISENWDTSKEEAYLRRVNPPPSTFERVPVSDLRPAVASHPSPHDALTRLIARAGSGMLRRQGVALGASTEFKEYQFRPLIKYLRSTKKRILIADEPGLGKTIEAGYIILEEMARSGLDRILVLCPANLRNKWREEMWLKFGLSFQVVYSGGLRSLLRQPNPFRAIASMDSLKGEPSAVASMLASSPIDMLVIDEIHHLIGRDMETKRRVLGRRISEGSRRVVGLSGTPIQLEEDDLRRVLEVVLGADIGRVEFEN